MLRSVWSYCIDAPSEPSLARLLFGVGLGALVVVWAYVAP